MEEENPFQYLMDGNILIIDHWTCAGFEWPTVVLRTDRLHSHEFNAYMRCTTVLPTLLSLTKAMVDVTAAFTLY